MLYKPLLALALVALALPVASSAAEIQYGSLKDQKGDTLLLEYKGPGGAKYYTCPIESTICASAGSTLPDLFPSVAGSKVYAKSADGRLAVREIRAGTLPFYFLYDISGSKPKKLAQIPFLQTGAQVSVSKNNDAVVFKNGLTYTRYDIKTKAMRTLTLQKELAFMNISPSASYITGYNYGTGRHELWSFAGRTKFDGPSAMQSYLEFSEDEKRVAYLEDVQGFRTLFTMPVSELGKTAPAVTQLTKPNTETEDYLFIGSTLYFMANVEGPLEWDLFAFDGAATKRIDTDVSYGDFLKRVRTSDGSLLAYLKTTGKNTNVLLVAPGEEPRELSAVRASAAAKGLTREVKVYGKRTGVLISPTDAGTKKRNLFIWLHGGPQRQVAKGYHPYLSYAVYDELVERLAEGGAYVYKMDYTGSTGYGADFRKALDMKIGDSEMKDVRNAIADIKKDKSIDKAYLIGNSYGGYMAFRGIVDMPKELTGVVSINGVSDWYGLISQIPSSPFRELFDGVPDTHNMDAYKQASVFTGMDKLTKDDKVLVVWGELDSTVPVWQSTKYLDFAKTQKATIGSLSFKDEDHILRKRQNLDALCKKVSSFLGVKASCSASSR